MPAGSAFSTCKREMPTSRDGSEVEIDRWRIRRQRKKLDSRRRWSAGSAVTSRVSLRDREHGEVC